MQFLKDLKNINIVKGIFMLINLWRGWVAYLCVVSSKNKNLIYGDLDRWNSLILKKRGIVKADFS